ncbi:hypothetical protein DACRYDRAFT_20547, partial [Dacryopinax primogenitus]
MLRKQVMGRRPIKHLAHDTLLRCISAWVDVFRPIGRCLHSSATARAGHTRVRGVSNVGPSTDCGSTRLRIACEAYPWRKAPEIVKVQRRAERCEKEVENAASTPGYPEDIRPRVVPPRPPDPALLRSYYNAAPDAQQILISAHSPSPTAHPPLRPSNNTSRPKALPLRSHNVANTSDMDLEPLISVGATQLRCLFCREPSLLQSREQMSPDILMRWYFSAKRLDEDIILAREGVLSSLITLFGSLSLVHSPIPGSKCQPNGRYRGHVHDLHQLTSWFQCQSNIKNTYWTYVRRLGKEKHRLGVPLDERDTYWLFMAFLGKAHKSKTVLRRKVAIRSASNCFPTLQHFRIRHVYGPYIFGLLSSPLTEDILQEAVRAVISYNADPKPAGWKSLPSLYWEVWLACAQCKMTHLVGPLINSIIPAMHLHWKTNPLPQRTDEIGTAPFLPIPTATDLYRFLLNAIRPVAGL